MSILLKMLFATSTISAQMPYDEALRFLFDRVNYERWRDMPYDPQRMGLGRMRQLLDRLGSPDRRLPILHLAGTKGKGSTSAMLAAALTEAGYRTGLYTSPHLERIEERIAIDGRPVTQEEFAGLVGRVRPAVENMDRGMGPDQSGPTFFEILTAMALLHFAQKKVQAAVLEVGLGGRLDATNACRPEVSIITSISFDHTQQLGNTLAAIAREKAGIIKPGVPVVSGVVEPEARDVIRQVCRERGCRLIQRGTDFDFDFQPPLHLEREAGRGRLVYRRLTPLARNGSPLATVHDVEISLPGRHQAANAATALAALDVVQAKGWNVPDTAIRRAMAHLNWPARVEVLARRPAVVLDSAHNVASVRALLETLDESFSASRRLLVFGTTLDKDLAGMLRELSERFDEVFFTRYSSSARGVPPEDLQKLAAELTGKRWPVFADPGAAWAAARAAARTDDLICITGSFYLAAEMKRVVLDGAFRETKAVE